MIRPVRQHDSPDHGAAAADRLQRLAAFIPRLRGPREEAAQPLMGEGTDTAPYRLGVSPTASPEAEFSQMAYDAGWVIEGFDWVEWIREADGGARFTREPAALAGATEDDLARLLTTLVRQERFVDGTLEQAIANGVLRAAAERAQSLLKVGD